MVPETRYAKSDEISIAYQVVGAGSVDLVYVMGWASHLDWAWQEPSFARFLRRLASFSRLILFDKRGTGLSDRAVGLATTEQRMDDVRAVMDAAGSRQAALLGVSEGAALCALFAATYPERTSALIMVGGYARRSWAPDYPWGASEEERRGALEQIERGWGGPVALAMRAPSKAADERFRQWWATYLRMSVSPGAAVALTRMNMEVDIRQVLDRLRVPTLLLHRAHDLTIRVESSRYMAERIPGSRYVELPGHDHLPFVGDQDAVLNEVEDFLTGARPDVRPERRLVAVLMTEICDATATASGLDEQSWHDMRDVYGALVRHVIDEFQGRLARAVDAGFLATFDSPVQAIWCACALSSEAQAAGFVVRSGLHVGECELTGDKVKGTTVQLSSSIMAHAMAGSVVVSQTIKDLTLDSAIGFQDLGAFPLRGVTGEWRLFRASTPTEAAPSQGLVVELGRPHGDIPLSHREREVATLVALGLSNRQIAEELVIASSTAERHIANILKKLAYHSRSQIAAWVVQQGFLPGRSG
jgi:pimeloyl-ACP methyl ester carboxylesterase/class 3 adenylate cyclase/DNA-binding CsgD family transcriptional regulator